VEQLVARWAHNPKVTGSSPVPATKMKATYSGCFFCLMVFHVYVLYSAQFDKIYIGFSSDLEKRILSHNELATKGWTTKFRPWILVHSEEFATKAEAMRREKELKSARGRQFIKNEILKR
jgi:putative endonuclease